MTAWDGGLALSYRAILEGKIKEETGTEKDKKRKVAEEPEKQKKQQKGAGKGQTQSEMNNQSKWIELQKKFDNDPASIVGVLADEIYFKERGKFIVRNHWTFDVSKLKEAVGEDTCLACAIGTSSNSKINMAFCNQKHEPGHEHNGRLHVMPRGWAEKFNDKLTGKTFRADFAGPN